MAVLSVPSVVHAVASCGAQVSPHTVTPSSSTNFQFTLTNNGTTSIKWIYITRPSTNFTITGASANGWLSYRTTSLVIFDSGTLASGGSMLINISATASAANAPAANWQVQASDDPDGEGRVNCSGELATDISTVPPAPSITNVTASGITSTSAKISWTTDQASSSQVKYGPTSSYGQLSSLDSTAVTSHSINLSGLSEATAYHFQVVSTNKGGTTSSSDNTFNTLSPLKSAQTSSAQVSNSSAALPASPQTNQATNQLNISLNPLAQSILKDPPNITGSAHSNKTIKAIEYSLDAGNNWLPADSTGNIGDINFSLKPAVFADGNYSVLARITDLSQTSALSNSISFVIDKLPPKIGGFQSSVGPQLIYPGSDGRIQLIAGLDQKIALDSIGGATDITILAIGPHEQYSFGLSQLPGSNIWTGTTSFLIAGDYSLQVTAVDGANNKVTRDLGIIKVSSPLQIQDKSKSAVSNAKLLVHVKDPLTNNWTIWDASSYGQINPITSDSDGRTKLYLPAGTFYMEVNHSQHRKMATNIVTITSPQAIAGQFVLSDVVSLNLGFVHVPLPNWWPGQASLTIRSDSTSVQSSNLVGKKLPDFQLSSVHGKTITSKSLLGKNTVISYLPTWSNSTKEQLPLIDSLTNEKNINFIALSSLEDPLTVKAYTNVGGYSLDYLIDPVGAYSNELNLQNLPTHLVIDKNGIVKKVMVGVLSKQELVNAVEKN